MVIKWYFGRINQNRQANKYDLMHCLTPILLIIGGSFLVGADRKPYDQYKDIAIKHPI